MRYLVLRSDASTVCGVEAFTRNLASRLGARAESHVLDGRMGALAARLADTDTLIFNFPIVAWKKRLFEPFLAAALARLKGRHVTVVLHEWASLDWKRRVVLWPVLLFADGLLFSAPEVEREWRQSHFPAFGHRSTAIVPIPPNMLPSEHKEGGPEESGPAVLAIRALKAGRRTVIGQFGSIYPKKNCAELLEIARVLKDEGVDVAVAFVGSFIKGLDNVEEDFRRQVEALGLADRVMVTGYIATDEEVFAACREVDIFCYRFSEGLTARRGSVLAAALAGRTVVTNAPEDPASLDHHRLFKSLIDNGNVVICPHDADAPTMAKAVRRVIGQTPAALDMNVEVTALWASIIDRLDNVQGRSRREA
ncbi:glycosyltransferase [Neorhizobium sp. NCHU2750]|uniref:glycosyltransferase n=1 Tax=Neorhizobium sp. NCHU2750 TaxID=1825976 RepID=UPI000E7087B7|nr:glycosyltransferase family 1 [Neorhizobium sp. NCHU2750]